LIVTADDFGLAEEVNAAVEAAHRNGILSAASLMVNGPAAADAVERAQRLPGLKIGLHVVLVDGAPALPPDCIPGLVDRSGRLRCDLARLGLDLACRGVLRAQMRAEIKAQFERYRATGLVLDHVDAHRHFHLHPVVAHEIISIGLGYGMRALRVPAEPQAVLARIEKRQRDASSRIVGLCAAVLRAQARRAGLLTPDAVFGLAWSGALTEDRLVGLLDHLPRGLIEIYAHPAASDAFAGHAPGYRYVDERDALCAPPVRDAFRRSGFRLGSYGQAADAESRPDTAERHQCLGVPRP
jgi:hopanoid biosynthesis associated protein HpnK